MARQGIPRRRFVLGAAAVAAAAGTYSLYRRRWAMPPDRSDDLADPRANLMTWPAAFGFTLIPLDTPEHFALWDDVWRELPATKRRWLAAFAETVDAPPIKENLPRFERAIELMLDGSDAEEFVPFFNDVYAEVFDRDPFVELVYVDGAYRVGEADPYTLAEWGLPAPDADGRA